MEAVAEHLRLPFRSRNWKGHAGNWMGAGTGSSIDFQDHRQYALGDDPRHIDWRAYARTDSYVMKLFREEISPMVDLVLDLSASMFVDEEKARRTWELFCFCETSARQSGSSVHCYIGGGSKLRRLSSSEDLRDTDFAGKGSSGAFDVSRIPWRHGSLRVVISDLLFPGNPEVFLSAIGAGENAIIFAPYCLAEETPDWDGNLEMEDCESGAMRLQRVIPGLLRRYDHAYRQHFNLWRDGARKRSILLARVPGALPFREALQLEALPIGAVELA